MRLSLPLSSAALLAASAALASPAVTLTPTTMRAAANSHSAVVQSIPANAEIDVASCGKIWCSASWRDIGGYIRVSAVSWRGDAPHFADDDVYYDAPPPPAYYGPPVVVAPVFGWGGYYGHPWRRW